MELDNEYFFSIPFSNKIFSNYQSNMYEEMDPRQSYNCSAYLWRRARWIIFILSGRWLSFKLKICFPRPERKSIAFSSNKILNQALQGKTRKIVIYKKYILQKILSCAKTSRKWNERKKTNVIGFCTPYFTFLYI